MTLSMSRRGVLVGAAALVAVGGVAGGGVANAIDAGAQPKGAAARDGASRLAALEKHWGGRLGVVAVDTATGRRIEHRAAERFPLCSTFKFIAAAAILQRVDRGKDHLDRRIEYTESDLLKYAPVAKEHVKEGSMVLGDLCAAAVQWSDNTAANLMLKILGGPEGLTAFIRTLGDNITRLDQMEPELNVVAPGTVNNTTTPTAMVGLLSSLLMGQVLSSDSRAELEGWMLDAKVGQHRLPAGLPAGWRIAHKTGTWDNQANDVGIVWPVNRAPIVVAAFYIRDAKGDAEREGVLREVGHIVCASL